MLPPFESDDCDGDFVYFLEVQIYNLLMTFTENIVTRVTGCRSYPAVPS